MMHQVLIVGIGSIGERHARCFQNTGRAAVGIVEVRQELRETVAKQYSIQHVYTSLDEALADRQWSSVVICTPASSHIALAHQCLKQGIATLIEKPLAVSLRDAQSLLQVAASSDVSIGVAYVYRAHPAMAAMRQAIVEGRFGRPLQVISVSGQHFPTYRPAYASTYFTKHATGGGTIQDALTHLVNAAQWIVGPMTHLTADVSQYRLKDTQVEDTAHIMARHGDVMAVYAQNQHQAPNETSLTIVCERGTTRMEVHRSQWMWQTDPQDQWHVEPCPLNSRDDWFERQSRAWLDVLDKKASPLCSLQEAYQTLVVNEAALVSSREDRRWIDLQAYEKAI